MIQFFLDFIALTSVVLIFQKSGTAWWKALIPFFNVWKFFQIAGLPGWVSLFLLTPIFYSNLPGVAIAVLAWGLFCFSLSHSFGHGWKFSIGLTVFPVFLLPVLAWSDNRYRPGAKKETLSTHKVTPSATFIPIGINVQERHPFIEKK